jgi:hypothetical protein
MDAIGISLDRCEAYAVRAHKSVRPRPEKWRIVRYEEAREGVCMTVYDRMTGIRGMRCTW